MNIDSTDRRQLERSSNVLLLAPLTPTGNRVCRELLATTTRPEDANVLAVTYTQPPETWVSDWTAHVGRLPAELGFIHANTVETGREDADSAIPPGTPVSRVDPNQPMDIVAPLSEQLTRWEDNDDRTLVAVQTLTILLEYVDFDTAFRYLHILTHRVAAADAVGFYHMDPEVHDAETVNTLKTLFDAVVEVGDDGEEWSVSETYGDRVLTSDHAQSHDTDVSTPDSGDGVIDSIRDALSGMFTDTAGIDASSGPGTLGADEESANADADEADGSATPSNDAAPEVPEGAMLSDQDRIRELLTNYGGRMKQTDVTEETEWSKSTVSRKLSEMEDQGVITRVQVGRGNIVFLSGYEPETAKPPFEGETD